MNELATYIISEYQRNADEKVRLGLKAYKGKVYFDLRIWFPDKETLELIPSKKGICLNLDNLPQMRDFMAALESAKTCLPADFAMGETATMNTPQEGRQESGEVKTKASAAPVQQKKHAQFTRSSKPFTRDF